MTHRQKCWNCRSFSDPTLKQKQCSPPFSSIGRMQHSPFTPVMAVALYTARKESLKCTIGSVRDHLSPVYWSERWINSVTRLQWSDRVGRVCHQRQIYDDRNSKNIWTPKPNSVKSKAACKPSFIVSVLGIQRGVGRSPSAWSTCWTPEGNSQCCPWKIGINTELFK